MPKNIKQQNAASLIFGGSIGLVTVASILTMAQNNVDNGTFTYIEPSVATIPVTKPTDTPIPTKNRYVDGTYTTRVSYIVEGGTDVLDVTLTIKEDAIVDYAIDNVSGDRQSLQYIQFFDSNASTKVIDTDLGAASIFVSGATLTSRAFNNAVSQIKPQAKL